MAAVSSVGSTGKEAYASLQQYSALSSTVKSKMTQPVRDNPLKVDYKDMLNSEASRINTTNLSSQPVANTYGADGKLQNYTGTKVNKIA